MDIQKLQSIVADQREEMLANDYSEYCSRPEESQLDLNSNRAQVVIGVRRSGKSTFGECCRNLNAKTLPSALLKPMKP